MGQIEVMPQEIGRVLLNLYNNAFYAANERGARSQEQGLSYQPRVTISTRLVPQSPERASSLAHPSGVGTHANGLIEIRVSDNGTGIPDEVKQKIFQTFFTTKPTSEGTGLGLSLSYDIVMKGHGETLTVVSEKGKGTELIIML